MSFDKAIERGKTKRKPYRGGKRFDMSCRNHGGCPVCEGNRLHAYKVREESANEQMKEIIDDLTTKHSRR